MLTNHAKRWLAMLLAVVMILSAVPAPVFAAEEDTHDHAEITVTPEEERIQVTEPVLTENVLEIQERIDTILTTYLGTTSATLEEIQDVVAGMDEITRMDLQFETLLLEEDMSYMELSEDEQLALVEANAVYSNVCDVLMDYPVDFALYTTVTVLDGKVSVSDTANSISASGNTVTATAKGSLARRPAPSQCITILEIQHVFPLTTLYPVPATSK